MVHLLSLPWGFKHPDVSYDKKKKVHFYKGSILPPELKFFATEDFSYTRWIEDEQNGAVTPPQKFSDRFTPRSHQIDAAKAIKRSHSQGWSGFLEADATGLGKTLSILTGVSAIAKGEGFSPKKKANLLIVCPKGVIPQWRHTLHRYPVSTALMRPMIVNYEQLRKLLNEPKTAHYKKAKKPKTKNRLMSLTGTSKFDWDFIVFDEAHYLKNYPKSSTSVAAANIAQLNKPYVKGKTPFTVFSTATPGSSPLNFAVMANLIAPLMSDSGKKRATPDSWGEFLMNEGFNVKEGKLGWTWATASWFGKDSEDPKERRRYELSLAKAKRSQRQDAKKIGQALKKPHAPFIMRKPTDLAGWPEQQFIPLPIELTPDQRPIYEQAWSTFRSWMKMTPPHTDSKGALVQTLRYRQKASLLKAPAMIAQIKDWIDAGYQVAVSLEFLETLDAIKEGLEASKITVSEISGRNPEEREEERLRFQRGEAVVCLYTVVAGISLHQEESLPDGTKATSTPRMTALVDVRQNPLNTLQAIGRAHRDGQNSLTFFPYLENTVDENVISSFVNKNANLKTMMGSSKEEAESMESLFRSFI